jgi:hypothetical protein
MRISRAKLRMVYSFFHLNVQSPFGKSSADLYDKSVVKEKYCV